MKKLIYSTYVIVLATVLLISTLHFTSKISYVTEETLPSPTPVATAAEEGFSPSVCVTKNGKKYHKSNCEWIKDSIVLRYTKNKAISMGYEPCSACKP